MGNSTEAAAISPKTNASLRFMNSTTTMCSCNGPCIPVRPFEFWASPDAAAAAAAAVAAAVEETLSMLLKTNIKCGNPQISPRSKEVEEASAWAP